MKYDYIDEGKVIIVNGFRFEDGKLDHAWNTGRPCLVLFSDEEYQYVLPIKSEVRKLNSFDKFPIDKKSFESFNEVGYNDYTLNIFIGGTKNVKISRYMRKDLSGYINLEHIFKIPLAYRNEIGKIKKSMFKEIVDKLHMVQKTNDNQELTQRAFLGK